MGMTINEALEQLKDYEYYTPYQELISFVSDWIEQSQSNYENRLKADMVAMLEEFDLELSEYEDADLIRVEYIRQDIQEKINALKAESEVEDGNDD